MASEQILIVDEDTKVHTQIANALRGSGYRVQEATNGEEALLAYQKWVPDLLICSLDIAKISGLDVLSKIREVDQEVPFIVTTGSGSIASAIAAMRQGAFHYLMKPIDTQELLTNVQKALEARTLKKEVQWLRRESDRKVSQYELIGSTPAITNLTKLIDKVAGSDAPTILLEGESGTGKNLAARLIHFKSRRNSAPFVEINCASLPETLIESELFGHERGSFTDAKQMKRGLFEVARGGTIFLDEIGEISMSTQAKLLQAIENHTFRRVGGLEDIATDARVIASTNVNLKEAVSHKKFREDLYFRLELIPIHIPSLRERAADIPFLVQAFVKKFNREYNKNIKGLMPEAEVILKLYSWPGNVRELRNVVERIVIMENDEWIQVSHLPIEIQTGGNQTTTNDFPIPPDGVQLEVVERQFITQALSRTAGNQSRAAKLLGITRHTLRYRMEKFGIH